MAKYGAFRVFDHAIGRFCSEDGRNTCLQRTDGEVLVQELSGDGPDAELSSDIAEMPRYQVTRFTGCQDRQGEDIYAGDVLIYCGPDVDLLGLKTGSEIVVSDCGHFFNNGRYYHLCELVGNVFEKGRIPGL